MDNAWNTTVAYVKQRLYPFTFTHIVYVICFTALTTMISEYIFRFRLLKWIYIGTFVVMIATLFKAGDDRQALKDMFKLATV